MTDTLHADRWISTLPEPPRSLILALVETGQELEDSAPIDRLRLLAKVRQALANARAAWGEEVMSADQP